MAEDDWFDPLLTADTRLFIDPFRIFVDTEDRWRSAHGRLIDFFNLVLERVALSGFKRTSAHWRAASRLLIFPEPAEICLGYAEASTQGAGSGRGLQEGMLGGAVAGIRAGIREVSHFEELTLFEAGIGADRISDIVANVLKAEFIEYTRDIAGRNSLAVERMRIRHSSWSREYFRWEDDWVELPTNPYAGKPVLLVPQRFLRELPTVDPAEFWDWAWTNENDTLRDEFNYEIGRNVDARTIVRLARRHPTFVSRYVRNLEGAPKPPYDFDGDPAGEAHWYEYGAAVASATPLALVATRPAEFCDFVRGIIEAFKHNVEQQDGWTLLWHKDRHRTERIVQALFRSTVTHYCRANNIDLTGEANAGRGPVDFKFSRGWEARALAEVKHANNSAFWHGLEVQTPTYLRAEGIGCGYFVVICYSEADFEDKRRRRIIEGAKAVSNREAVRLEPIFVDARAKVSASRA